LTMAKIACITYKGANITRQGFISAISDHKVCNLTLDEAILSTSLDKQLPYKKFTCFNASVPKRNQITRHFSKDVYMEPNSHQCLIHER